MDRSPKHVRTIRIETERADGDEVLVRGVLLDQCLPGEEGGIPLEIHHMEAVLRATPPPDVRITDIAARMLTYPNAYCPEALDSLGRLRGMRVGRGFTRALQNAVGRQRGCAHLTTLVLAMAPSARRGAHFVFPSQPVLSEELEDLVNTCYVWREGGPLWDRLRRGELQGLSALTQSLLR